MNQTADYPSWYSDAIDEALTNRSRRNLKAVGLG